MGIYDVRLINTGCVETLGTGAESDVRASLPFDYSTSCPGWRSWGLMNVEISELGVQGVAKRLDLSSSEVIRRSGSW